MAAGKGSGYGRVSLASEIGGGEEMEATVLFGGAVHTKLAKSSSARHGAAVGWGMASDFIADQSRWEGNGRKYFVRYMLR